MSGVIQLFSKFFNPLMTDIASFWSDFLYVIWKSYVDAVSNFGFPWNHIFGVLLLFLIAGIYNFLFSPYKRIKPAHSVGYNYLKNQSGGNKEFLRNLNEAIKRRKIGDIPPVYPNGWFALIHSSKLKIGEVTEVSAIGENFAVYRGQDGKIRILDAYCPHLGANLGIGGMVVDNCLKCPFHGWEFNGQGKCTKIPYSESALDMAKIKAWNSCEKNGFIFVWYHAENSEPTWSVPDVEEINNGTWKYCGYSDHYINSHIQDIPENAGDIAHLGFLHAPAVFSGSDIRYTWTNFWTKVVNHVWHANWSPDPEPNAHLSTLELIHRIQIFGKEFKPITIKVFVKQIGPGIVHLTMNSFFGKGVLVQLVTPVAPLQQRVIHTFHTEKYVPMILGKGLLFAESLNFERDIMIWNNKTYIRRPILVKEDKLIKQHRRWFSQFYSENSPKFSFQSDNLDW